LFYSFTIRIPRDEKIGDTAGARCSGTSFGRLPAMFPISYSFTGRC
jgi:hypothetical protein